MDFKKYYNEKKDKANLNLTATKKKANALVFLRVVVFFLIIFCVYLTWGNPIFVFGSIVVLGLGFGYLIKIHSRFDKEKKYWSSICDFYTNEIAAIENDFSWANNGSEYKTPEHKYANDIDLFGALSFFHRLNRTNTKGGEKVLAKRFSNCDIQNIEDKQKAIEELATKSEFIESFVGTSKTNESDIDPEILLNWFKNYNLIFNPKVKIVLLLFPILSIIALSLYLLTIINGYAFSAWFVLGLVITGVLIRNTLRFNTEINRIADNIKTYGKLLEIIEKETFESTILNKIQQDLNNESNQATAMLHSFTKKVDLFNNRNNFLVGIFGNALLLWDSQTIFSLERWIDNNRDTIANWIVGIFEIDAYVSLGIYKFNNPLHIYPKILPQEEDDIIKAISLGHPMISKDTCICSDVSISKDNFLIITGANMAGKSTFLRTIGLSLIMTNVGLPLYAKEVAIKPQKLVTSMRTTDSLKDDESYFFAELKRLKFIVDIIQKEPHFIILDEILKGTNSKDKEEGSKQFVRKLLKANASGIIATHDLGLCTIADESSAVENYYFDAEIVNDELYFDYKMKDGICKNMNASFLLKKMEIV